MGNFSRDTFNKLKHYVGVRLQQGVPLVDADWNEQEDIRKYELQAFLKWFVGNGVPKGNDGFSILPVPERIRSVPEEIRPVPERIENDFIIKGGDGTPEGAGRILVEGWDVINESNIKYTKQPLYNDGTLAEKWGVDPLSPLTTPENNRTDTVYLDVWEREVDAEEDNNLVNPKIGIETCTRLKREWVVRVAEGETEPPTPPSGHAFYPLASLVRERGKVSIDARDITDLRKTGLGMNALSSDLESHLQNTNNPHNVTADQIGALAASDYEFHNRAAVNALFTHLNANGALKSINVGFVPKFVFSISYCNTKLAKDKVGVNAYGCADLRGSFIQWGTHPSIFRFARTPYWRQEAYHVSNHLCLIDFSDETIEHGPMETLGVFIANISASGLTLKFLRYRASARDVLPSFSLGLRLLLLG